MFEKASRIGAAAASFLMVTLWVAGTRAQDAPSSPPKPSPFPAFPVQEGDDPLQVFVPKSDFTSEEKLRAEALAWFMTAQLHYSRGENTEGLAALKKSVERDPTSLTPYRAIVPALIDARDFDHARKYALEAAGIKPEGVVLVQGVALVLARLRKFDEAVALLNEVLPLTQKSSDHGRQLSVQTLMGRLQRLGKHNKEAAEQYKQVFEELQKPENQMTPEKFKELLGEPGPLYDEFGNAFLESSQPELALKAFDEASKHRQSRPGIHSYNLALLFRETKKPEEALTELEKYFAAQLQTKGRAAYQLLKDILSDLKRDGELIERLEKLHQADTQNAALAYFLADQYVAAGRIDDALKAYTTAPGGSRDPRALTGLISIYRQKKNYSELLATLPRAFQVVVTTGAAAAVDPEIASLASRFEAELEAIKSDDETLSGLIAEAHKLQNEDPPKLPLIAAEFMGRFCIDAKRSDDALSFYRHAISMQNTPPARLYGEIAGHLIQAERFKQAIEILGDAIQHPLLEEERPYFIELQCAAYEMDGQTDKALAIISQAKQDYPRVLSILSREAWIYYHAQQWEKAIQAYEALIQVGPSLNARPEFLNTCRFSLSAIYVHLENFDKGEKILEDVLEKDPENTQANNDLGYLWADRGKNLERAKTMIEKALAVEPDNAAYLDSMGWIQFRLGNYSEAKEHLIKATKDPNRQDATIWDHLGDVYDKLGDKEESIKSYVKALEIEFAKPKPDEKLVEALIKKTPAERIPPKKPAEKK